MKTKRWMILLAACGLSAANLCAEEADPFGATGAAADNVDPFADGGAPSLERTAFDFTFPGGTLREFANLIEHSNNALRIIVPTAFADAPVPSMHFKGVNLDQLHELVSTANRPTESRIQFEHVLGGSWFSARARRI